MPIGGPDRFPKHHNKRCWAGKALAAKRAEAAGGMITGGELARRLGVGRTTITRWIKSGKIPQPTKRTAKMLLWEQSVLSILAA